ncbi:Gfo/Idh/MocA family oxidoreductase, partial [Crossiella equi]
MAVAIVGFDSSRPARLLELLGGPEVPCRVRHVGRVEEVGAVDAVLLCTRDGREHAAQALPLLARGISVWVDKPLATTEADARAMVRAAVDGGLVLACRSGLRDAPAVRRVAEWVRETPGPVTVRIEGPAPADNPYGGRAFYGIHHVELACELARSP